jgi:hypothetical protein
VSAFLVRLAVRLLPSSMRDRYREQWDADLRDAADVGIGGGEIALGALAFAITLDRSSIAVPVVEGSVDRRARLASALALSSALVVLTQYASLVNFSSLTGNGLYDFVFQFLTPLLLIAYVAIAPVVALFIIVFTRGMYASVRWAVTLLVGASGASIAQSTIDSGAGSINNIYATTGMLAYVAAIALALAAVVLLARQFRWLDAPATPQRRHPLLAAIAGAGAVLVWGGGAVGLVATNTLLSDIRRESVRFIDDVTNSSASAGSELAAHYVQSQQSSAVALSAWLTLAGVLGVLILAAGLTGRATRRRVIVSTLAALCVAGIAFAGITSFIRLMSIGGIGVNFSFGAELVLLTARWVLIAIVLFTVGGVRLTRGQQREQPALV